jgi:hypothetical protein
MLAKPCAAGLDPLAKALNHWPFRAYAKMLEIGIIAIIVLAVGYWVTLWLMGRHDDVLHGDFVHPEGTEAAASSALPVSPFPAKPFPAKPFPAKPSPAKTPAGKPVAANVLPAQAPPATSPPRPDRSDTLQSLLASIKRDLKDASQL